jgi:hypothetical protein
MRARCEADVCLFDVEQEGGMRSKGGGEAKEKRCGTGLCRSERPPVATTDGLTHQKKGTLEQSREKGVNGGDGEG